MIDPIQEGLLTEKNLVSLLSIYVVDPGICDNENLHFIFKLYFFSQNNFLEFRFRNCVFLSLSLRRQRLSNLPSCHLGLDGSLLG